MHSVPSAHAFLWNRRIRYAALLALACVVTFAGATVPANAEPDPGLRQRVAADETVVSKKPITLDTGHIDLGPRLLDGAWTLMIRDDNPSPPVWRHPEDVVIAVPDAARLTAPKGKGYEFLGAARGKAVHVIPQTQDPRLAWLGWNTQDPDALAVMGKGSTMTLLSARGPAPMTLFLQDGAFGSPQPLWVSERQERQDIWLEANSHTHANWIFPAAGEYVLDIEVSAQAADGSKLTDSAPLRFAVGDAASVEKARALEPAAAAATGTGTSDGSGTAGAESGDLPVPLPVVLGAGGALGLVVLAMLGSGRRRRRLRAATTGPR